MVVGLVAAVVLPGRVSAAGSGSSARLPGRTGLLFALNAIRRRHGLTAVTLSPALDAAAMEHSGEMIQDGYFAHDSANGRAYWKRIAGFYPALSGTSWAVGEILLWTPGTIAPRQAVHYWMSSPEHRATILSPRWRQVGIGIGIGVGGDAPGVFDGSSVEVLTADFGARS